MNTSLKCIFLSFFLTAVLLASIPAKAADDTRKPPPQVEAVLAKVGSLLEKKEYRKAEEMIEALQSAAHATATNRTENTVSHHPELFFALGNCYLLENRYPEAAKAYNETVTRDPRHTHGWLNLAKAHYEMKQYTKAGYSFRKGYDSEDGKRPENLYYSGASYLMAGEHQEALAALELLMTTSSQNCKPEWKEQYIQALLGAGQARRALPLIRELTAHYTGDKQIQWQEILLYQYVHLNMNAEALNYARKLTETSPHLTKWWKALVHVQLNAGHLEEALTALIISGYLAPLSAEERTLLADLYLQTGIPVKAVPVYAECMQTGPSPQLLQRLAFAYNQTGKPEAALQAIDRFKQQDNDPRLLMLKGELLYGLKRYAEAAAGYRQAAKTSGPHCGQAWLMAGYASMQIHDVDGSREALAKAALHDKEKKAATIALHQLQEGVRR